MKRKLPRLRYQLGVSAALGRGSASLNWVGSKPYSGASSSFVTASFSQAWNDGIVMSVTGLHDLVNHRWSVQAALTMPVGDGDYASASALDDNGRASGQAIYDHPVNPDGGFGYRVIGEAGDNGRIEGNASWLGTHARLDGDVSVGGGKVALRGGVSGALVLIDGSLFAARETGGAVALVEAGQSGVRIYRENRLAATSGDDGRALLTGLAANADNHIAVEPRDYPITALLSDPERTVAPRRRAGIVVDFAPVSFSPAFLTIETGGRCEVVIGRGNGLERDDLVELQVHDRVNLAHSSFGDEALHPVPARDLHTRRESSLARGCRFI